MKKKLAIDWGRVPQTECVDPALIRYRRFLEDHGFKDSTILSHVDRVRRYLKHVGTDHPSINDFKEYRQTLLDRHLSRSTINNTCGAIKRYYEMNDEEIRFPFLPPTGRIPYYFAASDILKIFEASAVNLKHYTMLNVLFYGCLRASELCGLDLPDVDLKNQTLRLKETKSGPEQLVFISDSCCHVLRTYLGVLPSVEIDSRKPLFFSDYGNRWDRRCLAHMFMNIKRRLALKNLAGYMFSLVTPLLAY